MAMIGTIRIVVSAVAIQHVSWHPPRAVDLQVVQGAMNENGLAGRLFGFAGTVQNTALAVGVLVTKLTERSL